MASPCCSCRGLFCRYHVTKQTPASLGACRKRNQDLFSSSHDHQQTLFSQGSRVKGQNTAQIVQFSQYSFWLSPQLPETPFALERKQQHRTVCTQTEQHSVRGAKAQLNFITRCRPSHQLVWEVGSCFPSASAVAVGSLFISTLYCRIRGCSRKALTIRIPS